MRPSASASREVVAAARVQAQLDARLPVSVAEYEAIEATTIAVNGGDITVVASDDGVNAVSDTASPTLTVTGGTLTVDAGGDGLDVTGSITITGGTVVVDGPTEDSRPRATRKTRR